MKKKFKIKLGIQTQEIPLNNQNEKQDVLHPLNHHLQQQQQQQQQQQTQQTLQQIHQIIFQIISIHQMESHLQPIFHRNLQIQTIQTIL